MALGLHSEVVFDLHLVATTQIDAAVALLDHLEFNVQDEVGEFLLSNDVSTMWRVLHNAVNYSPGVSFLRIANLPPRQVASIEQRDRLTKPATLSFKRRRSNRGPLQRSAVRVEGCPFQTPANQIPFELEIRFVPLVLNR